MVYSLIKEASLAGLGGAVSCGGQSSGCKHLGEKAVVNIFCRLSTFILKPKEGCATSLNLAWRRLCCFLKSLRLWSP